MRLLPTLTLLMLAACGSGKGDKDDQPAIVANIATQPDPAHDRARPMPDPASPPAASREPISDPSKIPASLQGQWIGVADRCGDAMTTSELTITPDSLVFHESVGTVQSISRKADGAYAATASFTGEGQTWTRTLLLRPAPGDRELAIDTDGTMVKRKRC